jgi:hypothetical protein
MLSDALSFPRRGDDWVKNVLIGGGLTLLGLVIPLVPLLPVQGYLVRVVRSGVREEAEPPAFEDWGDLFVDGILLSMIQLVYVLVPVLLLVVVSSVVGIGLFTADVAGSDAGIAAVGLVGALSILASVVLLVVVAYLIPAAVANFAHEGEFGAAFSLSTVSRAAFTGDYLVAVLLAVVVGLVLGLVAAALTVIVVGIFLAFYVQVVTYYLFGRGFGEALGIEADEGAGGSVEPTGSDDDSGGGDNRIPDPDPLT